MSEFAIACHLFSLSGNCGQGCLDIATRGLRDNRGVYLNSDLGDLAKRALAASNDQVLMAEAVRKSMDAFAVLHPGRSVEVRVPPYRVVQILGGATHRRGTPPAVVEMQPTTWLELIAGHCTWSAAVSAGKIQASGVGSDLAELFGPN
jgi:Bacterial SCP ortholog